MKRHLIGRWHGCSVRFYDFGFLAVVSRRSFSRRRGVTVRVHRRRRFRPALFSRAVRELLRSRPVALRTKKPRRGVTLWSRMNDE